jgi:GNAT superfamily N-acetyltransferase
VTAIASRPIELPPYEARDLGDGLVLRSATEADAPELAEFNAMVHGGPPEIPDTQAAIWTRDLLRGDHPTSPVTDHVVVREGADGRIVSSCLLISQTWRYGGIPIAVGRPELVGTHPAYRGRGLIGAQFEVIHRRSEARGQLMQGLTGIPNFYRRFGYEPALIVPPALIGFPTSIAELPTGGEEPFRFRPVTVEDVPFVVEMDERSARRSLVAAVRDEAMWRYELTARDPGSDYIHDVVVMETSDGMRAGLVAHLNKLHEGGLFSTLIEVRDGVPWSEATGAVLRYVRAAGERIAERDGERLRSVGFDLVPEHPLLRLAASRLPQIGREFAWDVRVADLCRVLPVIAPLLEGRLAASALSGFTGDLAVTFYRSGVRLTFEQGRLAVVEPWLPEVVWKAEAAFPGQTFLYLLFGARSLEQVEGMFPDCRIKSDVARVLVETLFPVAPSVIWPVG